MFFVKSLALGFIGMNKTCMSFIAIDVFLVAVLAGCGFLAQAAPLVIPSSGWGFAGLVAILALQAWQMSIQRKNNTIIKTKVDNVADKTEIVHLALNSQLDAFKKEAAEQYRLSLDQGIALVKAAADKLMSEKMAAMEAKIAALEVKLDAARDKAVVLAATKVVEHSVAPDPVPVTIVSPQPLPVTVQSLKPEERHEEIKGGG